MKRDTDIAIKVEGITKSFKLPHEKSNSVKSIVINPFKKRTFEKQEVLKGISFEIKKGEFFGIVGRNGSGKSTLLKLLAGIYSQNQGVIQVNGKLTPFIELGVGFNPELTGRENVFLNGALLGFNRKEMLAMYDEIVEFAELEKFMDQKLKNYSSGMQVRLAFSIAIKANSDILVLDEVLAVGDYNFQQKCFEYFRELKKNKKTVVLVSHDPSALQMFCDRAVLIEKGEVKQIGKITDVLKQYALQNQQDQEKRNKQSETAGETEGDGSIELQKVRTYRGEKIANSFGPKENIKVTYEIKFNSNIDNPVFGMVIQDTEGGQPIFATNTLDMNLRTGIFKAGETRKITFGFMNTLNDGKYSVSGAVASSDRSKLYTRFIDVAKFSSVGWSATAKPRVYQEYTFESN